MQPFRKPHRRRGKRRARAQRCASGLVLRPVPSCRGSGRGPRAPGEQRFARSRRRIHVPRQARPRSPPPHRPGGACRTPPRPATRHVPGGSLSRKCGTAEAPARRGKGPPPSAGPPSRPRGPRTRPCPGGRRRGARRRGPRRGGPGPARRRPARCAPGGPGSGRRVRRPSAGACGRPRAAVCPRRGPARQGREAVGRRGTDAEGHPAARPPAPPSRPSRNWVRIRRHPPARSDSSRPPSSRGPVPGASSSSGV